MLHGCLFDLDGVIVDTAHFHYLAWKQLANRLGFEFTIEQNEQLKGISRMESLDIVLGIGGIVASDEMKLQYATEKNEAYLELCATITPADLLPGVGTFLENLKKRAIKIGLGSVSKNALLILKRLEVMDVFDALVDGNRIKKSKPDPEVFLTGAADLGVLPENCIVFEDAVAGVEAAHRAGMRCVGVGSPDILTNADWIIASFEGLELDQLLAKN